MTKKKNEISEGVSSEKDLNLDDIVDDLLKEEQVEKQEVIPEQVTQNPPPATPPDTSKPIEITETNKSLVPSKKDIMKEDALIKALLNDEGVFDLLDVVLGELAEESASLKYERIKAELGNKETDRLSLRRSNILKMISDALVQKRNLALTDFVNLRSPQWQIVFNLLLEKVRKTLIDLNYSSEQLELFFQKLQGNLEGFEETTEIKLRETLSRSD